MGPTKIIVTDNGEAGACDSNARASGDPIDADLIQCVHVSDLSDGNQHEDDRIQCDAESKRETRRPTDQERYDAEKQWVGVSPIAHVRFLA